MDFIMDKFLRLDPCTRVCFLPLPKSFLQMLRNPGFGNFEMNRENVHGSKMSSRIASISSTGKSKEAEIKRINKELANIRSKFKGE